MGRHVVDQPHREITLNTTNHIVVLGIYVLTDEAESVIFLDCRSGDTTEETLLHTALEAKDGDLGRGKFDVNGNLADEEPRKSNEYGHDQRVPECLSQKDTSGGQDVAVGFRVPQIPEDGEDPSGDYTKPAEESMESLKDTRENRLDCDFENIGRTYL
jgi:hypothetical protein